MSEEQNNSQQVNKQQPANNDRREALKKMGGFAAYTAPALLVMLTPKEGRAGVLSLIG